MTFINKLSGGFFSYDLLFFSLTQLRKSSIFESQLSTNCYQITIGKNWFLRTANLLNRGLYNYSSLKVNTLIPDSVSRFGPLKKVRLKALIIENAFIIGFRLVSFRKLLATDKNLFLGNFKFLK